MGRPDGVPERSAVDTDLHELDVVADLRRRGVGSRLVAGALSLAAEGSTRFWLSTGGHNTIAQALYESLGGVRTPLGDVNYGWQLELAHGDGTSEPGGSHS